MLNIEGVDRVFKDGKVSFWFELIKTFFFCSNVSLPAIIYEIFETVIRGMTPQKVVDKLTRKTDAFKEEIEKTLGNDGILLYPCFTSPAVYHKQMYSKAFDCTYLAIFNSLGLPATSCPIGFSSHGLPIGIQVKFLEWPS